LWYQTLGIAMLSKLKKEFSFLRGNLLVLIISYMLFRVSGGLTTAYYPLYVRELGASPFVIGLISSLASLVVGVMRIPGGYFADRFGRKKIIVVFTFVAAFSYLIFAAAPNWKYIALATVVTNLSFVYFPALNALEADSIPEESRGMGYAATQMLPHLTSIGAPLLTAYFIQRSGLITGVRYAYVVAAVFVFASAVVRHFYLQETLSDPEPFEMGQLKNVFSESLGSIMGAWKDMPKNVSYFAAALLIHSLQQPILMNFHPLYATDIVGITESQWGQFSSISMLIALVLALPMGRLIDRVGRKRGILLYFLFSIPTMVFLIISRGYNQHFVVIVLFALSNTFLPAFTALQADMIPKESRGRVIGSLWTLRNFAMIPSASIGGLLYEYHTAAPFVLAFVLQAISMGIIMLKVNAPSTN
jgi:MFS family permease